MNVPACDHDYCYDGVRYQLGGRVPGSGSLEVHYFEAFHCRRCLDRRYVQLGYSGNSYDQISFDAIPMEPSR